MQTLSQPKEGDARANRAGISNAFLRKQKRKQGGIVESKERQLVMFLTGEKLSRNHRVPRRFKRDGGNS